MTTSEIHPPAHETARASDSAENNEGFSPELKRRIGALLAALRKTTSALRGSEAQRAQLKAEISALESKLQESARALAAEGEIRRRLAENQERLAEHIRSSARRDSTQDSEQPAVKDSLPPDIDLSYRQQAEIERQEMKIENQKSEISALRLQLAEKEKFLRDVFESASWRVTTSLRRLTGIFRVKRQTKNVEKFDRTHLALILDSGIFDARYYLAQYPDVERAPLDPAEHYLTVGGFEGRKPHPLFDSKFYLTAHQDVAKSGVNPLVHFLLFGAKQGYNPNPLFLCNFYRESNPDVAASGANELAHYSKHGAWEGRDPNPFFDSEYYLKQHPDLRGGSVTPLQHYMETGWRDGANPHPLFWSNYYIETNADAAQGIQQPLIHFLNHGDAEGRDPNPLLHGRWYLETYPDAAEGPLKHFVTAGTAELLDPSPLFSTTGYLAVHPQLLSSGTSALEDILERARSEFSGLPKPWPTPLRLWWRDVWRTLALEESSAAPPKVSVIIPCYNQGNFLEDAVLSVLISKVPVEIIIVDDGSTDPSTVNEINRVERIYPVRVVRRANGGLAAARNSGLDAAQGEFIQFLDCDDVAFPEKLSRQLSHFALRPELAVSVCEYYLSNAYLSSWYTAQPSTLRDFIFNHESFLNHWERGLSIPIHCALFRSKFLGPVRFNEEIRAKEDWLFWLDVSKQNSSSESSIGLLAEPLAIYRLHGENMSRNAASMGQEFLRAVTYICRRENPPGFLERAVQYYNAYYVPLIQSQAKKSREPDPQRV